MSYRTFISDRAGWRYRHGIGDHGPVLGRRHGAPQLTHLAQSAAGELWASVDESPREVARIELPGLSTRSVSGPGSKLGALAVSPDGDRLLVTALPDGPRGEVALLAWASSTGWRRQPADVAPHISSRLAWLEADQVVFESGQRYLTLLDLFTGETTTLRTGRLPAAAPVARQWFAVVEGKVCEVGYDEMGLAEGGHAAAWRPVDDIRFGRVSSLAVTPDGAVFLWTEPQLLYRVKGYAQQRRGRRVRMRSLDLGVGIILSATNGR